MNIQPYILGTGRAGQAIAKSLSILTTIESNLKILPSIMIKRDQPLTSLNLSQESASLLFIANPSGLHAQALLAADSLGFAAIVCEKPAGVTLEEVELLKGIKTRVGVFHGFRQMWGVQTLKNMVVAGELGEIFSIEGKYWASSLAERSLQSDDRKTPTWKDDRHLNGPYDALLDLGSHWLDLAIHIGGAHPRGGSGWVSYIHSGFSHRDSHLHLSFEFSQTQRAFVSISKAVHGATNDLEIEILGSKRSCAWKFLRPDEIVVGEGRNQRIIRRQPPDTLGSRQSAFHGLGWLEGYVEIIHQVLEDIQGKPSAHYPRLAEELQVIKSLLSLNLSKSL